MFGRAHEHSPKMKNVLLYSYLGLVSVRNRFAWSFLGKYMICMTIQGVAFFFLTLLVQYEFWTWRPSCLRSDFDMSELEDFEDDEDVAREKDRVLAKDNPNDVLAIKNLVKK